MAENTRRVTPDEQGNLVGGFKPMPEGQRRAKTTEELITEAELRAEYEAGKRQEAEKSYRSGLNSYMRGSNRPFMFKPRPEDAKEANDARGSSIGQRDKNMGDQERLEDANRPQGKTGAFPAELETPGYNVIKPRKASWDSSTGEWKMPEGMKKGGKVKSKTTASSRGDGIAQRGKTKGRMC
jgi:hypothetical protein